MFEINFLKIILQKKRLTETLRPKRADSIAIDMTIMMLMIFSYDRFEKSLRSFVRSKREKIRHANRYKTAQSTANRKPFQFTFKNASRTNSSGIVWIFQFYFVQSNNALVCVCAQSSPQKINVVVNVIFLSFGFLFAWI